MIARRPIKCSTEMVNCVFQLLFILPTAMVIVIFMHGKARIGVKVKT